MSVTPATRWTATPESDSAPASDELARLRRALHHLRADRLRDLCRQQVGTLSDPAGRARLSAIRRMLHEIDDAERRMDNDTYGVCDRCAQPIELSRLRQVPYASACSVCLMGL